MEYQGKLWQEGKRYIRMIHVHAGAGKSIRSAVGGRPRGENDRRTDLQKTLRLMYKSNPTLFEWLSSPIVYMETEFAEKLRRIMNVYFSIKRSLYHYINMAEGNYREYLKRDMVRVKKYFYVLRPVLACRWILDKGTSPPMLFSELIKKELPEEIPGDVERLLDLKISSSEIQDIPGIDRINAYLDDSITDINIIIQTIKESKKPAWNELNILFLQELRDSD